MSHLYGLHPWDLERLTEDELNEYVEQAPDILKAVIRGR